VEAGVIGVAHHGEVTDQLFKRGKIERIKKFIKNI